MQKCVKNREYIEAQKAKDKIEEAQQCIKKRNADQVVDRMLSNVPMGLSVDQEAGGQAGGGKDGVQ